MFQKQTLDKLTKWRYGPAPYNKIQSKKLQYKSQMIPRGPKSEFIEKIQ